MRWRKTDVQSVCQAAGEWELAVAQMSWLRLVAIVLLLSMSYLCVFAGGILLPRWVSISDSGRGDAHQTGAGQGRAGEVPAVQRHLHCNEEGKGNIRFHETIFISAGPGPLYFRFTLNVNRFEFWNLCLHPFLWHQPPCVLLQLCFCCRTKRFSFFTWSYICQFCIK